MGVIYLVRHGQASFGGPDYDVLSELGHQQGTAVGVELRRRGIEPGLVRSGSLSRQLATAAQALPDVSPTVDQRWNEYDADEILARHGDGVEFSARPGQQVIEDALRKWACDVDYGAGSFPAFRRRIAAATGELTGQVGKGAAAVVFTSGGVISSVLCDILGLGVDGFLALNRVTANGSISTLTIGRSGLNLLSFNEHAHFSGPDAVPLTYR